MENGKLNFKQNDEYFFHSDIALRNFLVFHSPNELPKAENISLFSFSIQLLYLVVVGVSCCYFVVCQCESSTNAFGDDVKDMQGQQRQQCVL